LSRRRSVSCRIIHRGDDGEREKKSSGNHLLEVDVFFSFFFLVEG
jgi:hypothetical protein